jgi:hypothetical protein
MTDDRKGGIAMIAGAAGGIITMILHPSGRDLFVPGQLEPMAYLGVAVHALALASTPVAFLGALALSRRTAAPDRLAVAALVMYGFASAAVMVAAVVSGLVAPGLAREIITGAPTASEGWRIVFDYNGQLNQGFARVFAVASSAAIVLWSVAIVRRRALAPGVGIYGLLLGPAIIIAIVSGHLRPDVHGFGLVIFGQAVWFIVAGALLCRREEVTST